MREFDTLRAFIPPLTIVPGGEYDSGTLIPGMIGDKPIGSDYNIERDGWEVVLTDPGPPVPSGMPANFVGPAYYGLFGYHRSKIEWTPWARQDIALTPLGQDVAEGKPFAAHFSQAGKINLASPYPAGTTIPQWDGCDFRVLDIWSSEEIEDSMLENLAWNMDLPGAEPRYPVDAYTATYTPKNNPNGIKHKLRFDQVISARYRVFDSSSNAPTAAFWGGQLVCLHDQVIGGNASMAETIHHARYIYAVISNNYADNLDVPSAIPAQSSFNYLKVGFFIPGAIDTLTVGLNKIESDAEWSTIARRGASR